MSGTAMVPLVGETIRQFTERQPAVELWSRTPAFAGRRRASRRERWTSRSCARRFSTKAFRWSPSSRRIATSPCTLTIRWRDADTCGDKPLRTGTRITSIEEAFGTVAAGVAITCQGESAVKAVGAGFPQLRFLPLRGAPPAHIAVAWRTGEDSELVRTMVRIAIEVGHAPTIDNPAR
jgi:hypothetical protein